MSSKERNMQHIQRSKFYSSIVKNARHSLSSNIDILLDGYSKSWSRWLCWWRLYFPEVNISSFVVIATMCRRILYLSTNYTFPCISVSTQAFQKLQVKFNIWLCPTVLKISKFTPVYFASIWYNLC